MSLGTLLKLQRAHEGLVQCHEGTLYCHPQSSRCVFSVLFTGRVSGAVWKRLYWSLPSVFKCVLAYSQVPKPTLFLSGADLTRLDYAMRFVYKCMRTIPIPRLQAARPINSSIQIPGKGLVHLLVLLRLTIITQNVAHMSWLS